MEKHRFWGGIKGIYRGNAADTCRLQGKCSRYQSIIGKISLYSHISAY
jgi:hypothetical protein